MSVPQTRRGEDRRTYCGAFMYKHAFNLCREFWAYLLFCACALLVLDVSSLGSSAFVGTIALYGFMAFAFHCAVLTGEKMDFWGRTDSGHKPSWRFWVAYMWPPLVMVIVLLIVVSQVRNMMPQRDLATEIIPISAFVAVPFFVVLLAFIGTMLPAATLGHPIGLGPTLKRTRATFWFVLWRLVAGPVVVTAVWVVANISVKLVAFEMSGFVLVSPESLESLTFGGAIFSVAASFVGFFNTALATAILSMAYMKAGGEVTRAGMAPSSDVKWE